MPDQQTPNTQPSQSSNPVVDGKPLTDSQLADLQDEAKQAEYEKAYFEQLRRQACPGCGESSPVWGSE